MKRPQRYSLTKCLYFLVQQDVNEDKEALSSDTKNSEQTSPSRRRISDGIQSIMSRLNLSSRNSGNADSNERYLSPLKLNMYCNNGAETALHAAVRLKHNEIASALLSSGANPNLPALHNVSDQVPFFSKSKVKLWWRVHRNFVENHSKDYLKLKKNFFWLHGEDPFYFILGKTAVSRVKMRDSVSPFASL